MTSLTCLLVEKKFHLLLFLSLEGHVDQFDDVSVGQVSVHEAARAALLHDLCAAEGQIRQRTRKTRLHNNHCFLHASRLHFVLWDCRIDLGGRSHTL